MAVMILVQPLTDDIKQSRHGPPVFFTGLNKITLVIKLLSSLEVIFVKL